MTQFQQSASVRTLDTSERAYPAPFLAIVAGFVAVLIAVAAISFAVDTRPSDAAGYADTAAGNAYAAGLNAAITEHRVESGQRLADQWAAAGLNARTHQHRVESGQRLADQWAATSLLRPQEPAVNTYSPRFITAD